MDIMEEEEEEVMDSEDSASVTLMRTSREGLLRMGCRPSSSSSMVGRGAAVASSAERPHDCMLTPWTMILPFV